MNYQLILLLCLPPLCGAAATAQADDSGIRVSYQNSAELPDELAYREFLGFVEADPSSSHPVEVELVAQALALPHDKAGAKTASKRTRYFQKSLRDLQKEQIKARLGVLCGRPPSSRAPEDVIRVMNAADDVEQAVLAKRYLTDISQLPLAEQEALDRYLDNLKTSISYMRVDNRQLAAGSALDVREIAEESCSNGRSQLLSMQSLPEG